jgi:16S rRNA (cytidine1402-2'-O)-methyltransferase
MSAGTLILAATPIGNVGDASVRLIDALQTVQVIAAEDTRRLHKLLQLLDVATPAQIVSYFDQNEAERQPWLLDQLQNGNNVLIVTDAGMPSVSDPGYRIVEAAIAHRIPIRVLPGPSAVTTAITISGLPVDRFTFEGFLPRKAGERARRLEDLATEQRTMVFFEAPHRTKETLDAMRDVFGSGRRIAVCRELTKTYEEIVRGTLADAVDWAEREILGEITIVLAGRDAAEAATLTPETYVREVEARVAAGADRKEAVSEVAKALGVPRRDVYDAVVAAKRS